jgi:hypothetical protein
VPDVRQIWQSLASGRLQEIVFVNTESPHGLVINCAVTDDDHRPSIDRLLQGGKALHGLESPLTLGEAGLLNPLV